MRKRFALVITMLLALCMVNMVLADNCDVNYTYKKRIYLVINNYFPFPVKLAITDGPSNVGRPSNIDNKIIAGAISATQPTVFTSSQIPSSINDNLNDWSSVMCAQGTLPTDWPKFTLSLNDQRNNNMAQIVVMGAFFDNGALWCNVPTSGYPYISFNTANNYPYANSGVGINFQTYQSNNNAGFNFGNYQSPGCSSPPGSGNINSVYMSVNIRPSQNLPQATLTIHNNTPVALSLSSNANYVVPDILGNMDIGFYFPRLSPTIQPKQSAKATYITPIPLNGNLAKLAYEMKFNNANYFCLVQYGKDNSGACRAKILGYYKDHQVISSTGDNAPVNCKLTQEDTCSPVLTIEANPIKKFNVAVNNTSYAAWYPIAYDANSGKFKPSTPPTIAANKSGAYTFDSNLQVGGGYEGSITYGPDAAKTNAGCQFSYSAIADANNSNCTAQGASTDRAKYTCAAAASLNQDDYRCDVVLTTGYVNNVPPKPVAYNITINNNGQIADKPSALTLVTSYVGNWGSFVTNPPSSIDTQKSGVVQYKFNPTQAMAKIKPGGGPNDPVGDCQNGVLGQPCVVYSVESDPKAACVVQFMYANGVCTSARQVVNNSSQYTMACEFTTSTQPSAPVEDVCSANVNVKWAGKTAPPINPTQWAIHLTNKVYDDAVAQPNSSPVSGGNGLPTVENGQTASITYNDAGSKDLYYGYQSSMHEDGTLGLLCHFVLQYDSANKLCVAKPETSTVINPTEGDFAKDAILCRGDSQPPQIQETGNSVCVVTPSITLIAVP